MKYKQRPARPTDPTLQLRVRRDASGSVDIDVASFAGQPRRARPAGSARELILFLAANPRGTSPLGLAQECAAIQRELAGVRHRSAFRFEARWAVSVDDFMRHVTELEPTVLHVSGHGGGGSVVVLEDERGEPQPVSAPALAMMIAAAGRRVRVVVLNTCSSLAQVHVLRDGIDCIVGSDVAVEDMAARVFAVRFYSALGSGRSVGNAVAQGSAALSARGCSMDALPRCVTRDGVDAEEIVLGRLARTGNGSPMRRAGSGRGGARCRSCGRGA